MPLAAAILESIPNPPGPGLGLVVIRSPYTIQITILLISLMVGIKLQLLCCIRIELAVGSLPYLARIPSRSLPMPLGGT